ncbi:MAG: ribulose-phosphate 3-epimerase [Pirellulales bacterium]|nr:ribulose-phosphate 3-epimerase [Pirellulales bacterium]
MRELRAHCPAVLPSLLLCDFGRLAEEIFRLEAAGTACLHLDVMDGHFVPNLTYGLTIVEACRRCTNLVLDVHLMISNPADYLRHYRDAGANVLTIHIEAVRDPRPLLKEIHSLGAAAGLALNPSTPAAAVQPFLADCDLVLPMSVQPGFGGQAFDDTALDKLRQIRDWSRASNPELLLEVDGGINAQTISSCAAAGAQLFVVGSGIFRQKDYAAAINSLTRLAAAGSDNLA